MGILQFIITLIVILLSFHHEVRLILGCQHEREIELTYLIDSNPNSPFVKKLDDKFLSFALDTNYLHLSKVAKLKYYDKVHKKNNKNFYNYIKTINDPKFLALCKHLGPSTYFRFGGTKANTLKFVIKDNDNDHQIVSESDLSENSVHHYSNSIHAYPVDERLAVTELPRENILTNIDLTMNSESLLDGETKVEIAGNSTGINYFPMYNDEQIHFVPFIRKKRSTINSGFIKKSSKKFDELVMTNKDWDDIYGFCRKLGWGMIFTLNPLYPHKFDRQRSEMGYLSTTISSHHHSDSHASGSHTPHHWDDSNIRLFLNYSQIKGYKFAALELGNEPNSFPTKFGVHYMTPERLADYYAYLKRHLLVKTFPAYSDTILAGPGVTKMIKFAKTHNIPLPQLNRYMDAFLTLSFQDQMTMFQKNKKRFGPYLDNAFANDANDDLDGLNLWIFSGAWKFLRSFLKHLIVTTNKNNNRPVDLYHLLDRITTHHYYLGRGAFVDDYLDPDVLDSLANEIRAVKQLTSGAIHDNNQIISPRLWLGESGSVSGGGTPGVSDRFIAGFMFLDKLGTAAKHGVEVVIRQSLYNGNYAMIGPDLEPNPDYWTALLFKKLVGPIVLPVTSKTPENLQEKHGDRIEILRFMEALKMGSINRKKFERLYSSKFNPSGRGSKDQHSFSRSLITSTSTQTNKEIRSRVRVYAHCVNPNNTHYGKAKSIFPGAIVIIAMNLLNSPVKITFKIVHNQGLIDENNILGDSLHSYLLTSSDMTNQNLQYCKPFNIKKLLSKFISLNGQILRMGPNTTLPKLKPIITDRTNNSQLTISMSPFSYGFFVYPKSNINTCF